MQLRLAATAVDGFNSLTALHAHPRTQDLYVAEQLGRMWRLPQGTTSGARELVLDLTQYMLRDWGAHYDERGLLDFAFDTERRECYAFYTSASGNDVVVSIPLRENDQEFVGDQQEVLVEIPTRNVNHRGGRLYFRAPHWLYVSVGDGGPQTDPDLNAQNPDVWQGKIWRINVRSGKRELIALGLRNPWSLTWDESEQRLFVGDAGYETREEINVVHPTRRNQNFGWPLYEGTVPTAWSDPQLQRRIREEMIAPIWEYETIRGGTVIGGYFLPEHQLYVCGDFRGDIMALAPGRHTTSLWQRVGHTKLPTGWWLKSFGMDASGQLFMLIDRQAGVHSGKAAVWQVSFV